MAVILNEREQKLLQVAWQCMDVQPKIDYEKLAQLSGLGTKGSATTAWCVLKKKILTGETAAVGAKPKSPRKPKAPAAPKRKVTTSEDDDDDDDEEHPQSMITKRGKKANTGVQTKGEGVVGQGEGGGGGETIAVAPRAAASRPTATTKGKERVKVEPGTEEQQQ